MASLLNQAKPIYPAQAKMSNTQGVVVMETVIGKSGTVSEIKIISGDPVLSQAVADAVKLWCYSPALLNGEPIELLATVTANFILQ